MESLKPDKEGLRIAVGERLRGDHALTSQEIEELAQDHGYSAKYGARELMHSPGMRKVLEGMGVECEIIRHDRSNIYLNRSGPVDEAEQVLAEKKAEIDAASAQASEQTRQTIAARKS